MPPSRNDALHLDMIIQNINEIRDGQNTLYEIICSGDGNNQPLIARMLILEDSHENIKKDLAIIKGFQIQLKTEDRRAKWQILILLISSVLGWGTALITHISWSDFAHWLTTIIK